MRLIAHVTDFPKNVPIFLYGAGSAGETVLEAAAKQSDVTIVGFIDGKKKGQTVKGIPVLDLDGFLESSRDGATIVITSMYFPDISRDLRLRKFTNYYNGYPLYQNIIDRKVLRKGYALWAGILGVLILLGGLVIGLL